MAIEQHITVHRGADYELEVELQQADKTPLNPTGGTLHYRIATKVGAVALVSVNTPTITTAQLSGGIWQATVPLTDEQTEVLDPGMYYHELYFLNASGDHSVLLYGSASVVEANVSLV